MGSVRLDVGIVGAGIAGLAAAIALRRAGHDVTVYERTVGKSEIGAAVMMPPHAQNVLKAWNFNVEHADGTILTENRMLDSKTGLPFHSEDLGRINETYGSNFVSYHRADLQRELWRLAEHEGAKVVASSEVMKVDFQSGRLMFADDSIQDADFIVVADGVHSRIAKQLAPDDNFTRKSGFTCHRALIPVSRIRADPSFRTFLKLDESSGRVTAMCGALDETTRTLMVVYPCRSGEVLNVAVIHPTRCKDTETEHWNSPAGVEDVVLELKGVHPLFVRLVRTADQFKLYPLNFRDPISRYVYGRAIVIGDAAHPMLPLHGGGATTALEDAAALEILLSDLRSPEGAPSTAEAMLHARLTIWQAVRVPRNSVIQILSNTMFDRHKASTVAIADSVRRFYDQPLPDHLPPGWGKPTREFFCAYNALDVARQALDFPLHTIKHFGEVSAPVSRASTDADWNRLLLPFIRTVLLPVLHYAKVAPVRGHEHREKHRPIPINRSVLLN